MKAYFECSLPTIVLFPFFFFENERRKKWLGFGGRRDPVACFFCSAFFLTGIVLLLPVVVIGLAVCLPKKKKQGECSGGRCGAYFSIQHTQHYIYLGDVKGSGSPSSLQTRDFLLFSHVML